MGLSARRGGGGSGGGLTDTQAIMPVLVVGQRVVGVGGGVKATNKVLTSGESPGTSLKMAGILKTALCSDSGIPTKDKRQGRDEWGRAAKGFCFIPEHEAVGLADSLSAIGMRGLLTQPQVLRA